MRPIRDAVFRLVLIATISFSVLLCGAVYFLATQEFRSELRNQSAQTAELVLALAQASPGDRLADISGLATDPPLAEREHVLLVHDGAQAIYASWPAPLPGPEQFGAPELTIEGHRYRMEWRLDPQSGLSVALGIRADESIFASLEIVALTVLVFVLVMGMLLRLIRAAIDRGLRPMGDLAAALSDRGSGRLDPLTLDLPPDLRPIATAIDAFMARLSAAQQREREFLSNAAHELRTPLAGIIAQTDAVAEHSLPADAADRVRHIRQAAKRSARQVSQLLDHAFAQSRSDAPPVSVDLGQILREILMELAPTGLQQGVEFEFHCDGSHPVRHPEALLQILLQNLLGNAMKYCRRPGLVRVTCRRGAQGTELLIEDNGPGMSEEAFFIAQNRFIRSEPTAELLGHGLGLAIVGEISAEIGVTLVPGRSAALGGLSVTLTGFATRTID